MATILVVDDHPTNREFLATFLAYQGHRLLEAASGAEALDLVYNERPDLVIADIVMPAMDGYEFVRQLRTDPDTAATQVVFYTATYNEREARALARACCVEHILSKPAEPQVILDTITAALRRPTMLADDVPLGETFERDHTRLLTDKLARKVEELEAANRALERHAEALEQEVEARKQVERRQALQVAVTRILAESDTRYEAAPLLLETIGMGLGCALGELWRVDSQANELRWEHGWQSHALGASHVAAACLPAPIALGSGICGRVWAGARPEWAERIAAPLFPHGSPAGALDARSAFAFPIRGGSGVVGVMVFFWRKTRPPDETWLALLADIGSMIGQFFERKHAEEQLRLYTQRLRAMHAIDQAILALRSPEAIAQAALRHIRQLIPCRCAIISAFDWASGQVVVWAAEGDDATSPSVGARYAIEGLPMIDTLRRGEPSIIEDTQDVPVWESAFALMRQEEFRSIISVPLSAPGHLIGMLTLAAEQPSAFTPEYVDISREIGDHLAIAIQNAQLFQQVQVGRERLQLLSRQLVRAQEEERRRLASELHDEVGQALTATQLNLQVLLGLRDPRELEARLEDSLVLVERLLQQVRTLSLDLRPSMLDDLGLASALRWYLSRQAERAGFEVRFLAEPAHMRFTSEIETTCFRIAQETLTNIARHAQAQLVSVELSLLDGELLLVIRDDGVGFDVAAARERAAGGASLGLLGMQERALLIGGQVTIEAAQGQGAEVRARFPLIDGWTMSRRSNDGGTRDEQDPSVAGR
jgi:signal transduction histidine kinase/CheY-like chemotaxis protein